jgi:hypothetical protein
MQVTCPHCARQLDFTDVAPRFCAFCGELLAEKPPPSTIEVELAPDAPTLVPVGGAYDASTAGPGAVAAQPLDKIGPYRLIRSLGSGGMGTVYEAADADSAQHVAVKIVQTDDAASPEAIRRFRQEAELASQITHPRCVFVLAADEDAGRPYIVMELMTGSTLADLVREKGPLPVDEALRKIFDVIEGLQEAHQLGLVHRDVKPSNCFLDNGGRVKVGDFGLSRSLVGDSHMTRTGTFLGTPLFAAPEQIKRETVDAQSDLYSVAATLYFLLTGQAPFQTGDPMATMARVVSDNPPTMRNLRPNLPKALDKVVLRGLERDRKRRWRSLEEFRNRLAVFLPVEPSVSGLGLRFCAAIIDLSLVHAPYNALVAVARILPRGPLQILTYNLMALGIFVAYFGLLEGWLGCGLGKRLLRLRVGTISGNQPPGVMRALVRSATLWLLINLGDVVADLLLSVYLPDYQLGQDVQFRELSSVGYVFPFLIPFLGIGGSLIGLGAMLSTMRKSNGYRALHEFVSDTRTFVLQWAVVRRRGAFSIGNFHPQITHSNGLPETIGPFRVRGLLGSAGSHQIILGQDPRLGRAVWVWLRPARESSSADVCRTINRSTRPRWLACGAQDECQWDAFIAPAGYPLAALTADRGPLNWAEFRPILEDLTEELRASCAEKALPARLTLDQVWVDFRGRVQFLGIPWHGEAAEIVLRRTNTPDNATELNQEQQIDQQRALAFLGYVAIQALESNSLPPRKSPDHVRAPLPLHAADLFRRLFAQPAGNAVKPFRELGEVEQELVATREKLVEISRRVRIRQLAGQAMYSLVGLNFLYMLVVLLLFGIWDANQQANSASSGFIKEILIIVGTAIVIFFAPALYFRGGFSFKRSGFAIVLQDGLPASPLRCLGRALLAWGFLVAVALLSLVGVTLFARTIWTGIGLIGLCLAVLGGYVYRVLRTPNRAPHDYVTRTYIVPK